MAGGQDWQGRADRSSPHPGHRQRQGVRRTPRPQPRELRTGNKEYILQINAYNICCGKLSRLFAGCEQGAVRAGDAEQLVQEQQVQGRQGEGEY